MTLSNRSGSSCTDCGISMRHNYFDDGNLIVCLYLSCTTILKLKGCGTMYKLSWTGREALACVLRRSK